MSAHTPGPWRFRSPAERGTAGRWAVTPANAKAPICEINHYRERAEDDARLIAAAPELLDALRALAKVVDGAEWGEPWRGRPHAQMDAARAAIAKAEGV